MAGEVNRTKGTIKEAVGDITDDDELKREGKIDQVKGKAQDVVDKIGDALKD